MTLEEKVVLALENKLKAAKIHYVSVKPVERYSCRLRIAFDRTGDVFFDDGYSGPSVVYLGRVATCRVRLSNYQSNEEFISACENFLDIFIKAANIIDSTVDRLRAATDNANPLLF